MNHADKIEHDRAPDQQSRAVCSCALHVGPSSVQPATGLPRVTALTWQMGVPQETSLRCLQL